jgi:hypothetical protein
LDPAGVVLTDWQPGSHPCDWTFVPCARLNDSRHVVGILMNGPYQFKGNVRLSGQLPAGTLLCQLPAFRSLQLYDTGLRGTLPSDWSLLSNLEEVIIGGSEVSGE